MKQANNLHHFYMMAVQVTYNQKEGFDELESYSYKTKTMNVVVQLNKKSVTYVDLNQARIGVLHRMENEFGITPPDNEIVDVIFLNVFYLGLMSQAEFNGQKHLS